MLFSERCEGLLGEMCGGTAFLTPSCTAALELATAAIVSPGDEVIVPSFGFSSDANCVILRGATPVFVDIVLEDLNIDGIEISKAITEKTQAVIPVHYAGVARGSCYDQIKVIEDAAQCIGDFRVHGDFACISFHETKNVSCGQGGALLVRDEELVEKIQILRHCGTTKALVKHAWDWVEVGTQQLMSELLAEILWERLRNVEEVTRRRRDIWKIYHDTIQAQEKATHCGNGHIFWFLSPDRQAIRDAVPHIRLASHYTPLHNRAPGRKYGRTLGTCENAIRVSEQILRPPMNVTQEEAYDISLQINRVLDGLSTHWGFVRGVLHRHGQA